MDNPAEIANLVLDTVVHHIKVKNCSLMLTNERDELYILASRGHVKQFSRNCREKIGEGIAGLVAKKRRPVFVRNIDRSQRFRKLKRNCYLTKSFISCPITCKNKLLGVLNVNEKKDKSALTQEEFALIKLISNQAAIAFENHYLVNQLKIKASEMGEINHKLMEMDVMKTEFIMCMSHELRNPLNSIKGAVYYLNRSDNIDSDEQKEFFDVILNETDKLISCIENQLDYLKTEGESSNTNNSVIDLPEILVIEDNRDNMRLITYALRRGGYEVIPSGSGEEGVELALREQTCFIIVDINLPGIDGIETIRRIRNSRNDGQVPIIAITSYAMSGDRDRILQAGCNAYFEKPIDPLTIVEKIHDAIGTCSK